MGMTEHYIEIRSKCCGVKRQYHGDFLELEKIRIFLKMCGCDDPRYIFDSYVMNRTYVVPIAVELYYKRNLIIHIDLSDKRFRGKMTKYRGMLGFLAGDTVKYRIPAEYRNKKIKILFICKSPYRDLEAASQPVINNKDEDCCVCKKPFAEVKEEESDVEYEFEEGEDYIKSKCVKEHSFHKTCLNKEWLGSLEEQEHHGYRICPICEYFNRGSGENNLKNFCTEYIIYNKIKTNALPITLQNKVTEKTAFIKKKDSDSDDSDF